MIKNMTKEKKLLMWSVLLIAMVQMPNLALSPSINVIYDTVFGRKWELGTIQTVMQLPNLISPFVTIATAYLIGKGWLSKKGIIVAGLFLVAATGILSLFCNTQFWHLVLLSICLGLGLSGYLSTATSLIVDHFSVEERQAISGFQTSFINGGGVLMSLCGGLLSTVIIGFGGYLMLLCALPVGLLALKAIPSGKKAAEGGEAKEKEKVKIHSDVFLYGGMIFVFMLVYNVLGSNLSVHIKDIGGSDVAGILTAVQMLGGALVGIVFGKLSKKIGDFTTCFAFIAIFIGMMLLSLFPGSLPMTFVAVIIAGTAMSLMLPQCLFSVSKVVNSSSSALATSITSCIAPSGGGFFSAMVFTNLTQKLFGDSTVLRYRFVSFVALACAVILFVIFSVRSKKAKAAA